MEPFLQLAYQAMDALERMSGIPFPILAAVVAGAAIILAMILGRAMFRKPVAVPPKPEEPLQQLTTDRAKLEPENPALTGYRQILETKGIAPTEQHALIREYAGQLDELRHRMDEIAAGIDERDQETVKTLSEARAALVDGSLDKASSTLDAMGTQASETGRQLNRQAEQHLLGATLMRLVAGDLGMAAQEPESAGEHYRQAIESVPPGNEALLAECLNKHGTAMYRTGVQDAAAISFKRAAKLVERAKGPNDPDVATALNNLAMLYYAQDELGAAEPLYERALGIDEAALGPESTEVATDLNNLALLYKKQDRLEDAEPLMKRALDIKSKHFDPGHPSLVTGLRNYAGLLRSLGREEEAESFEARADTLPPKRRPEDSDG